MLIDSHCHLDFPDFIEDRDDVIRRAREVGVRLMLTISTKITEADKIISLAEAYDDIVCSMAFIRMKLGESQKQQPKNLRVLPHILKWSALVRQDLIIITSTAREAQKKNFQAHIAASRDTNLPLIVMPVMRILIPLDIGARSRERAFSRADTLLHRRPELAEREL